MKIIIDADACPDIQEIIDIAKINNIKVKLISDFTHNFNYDYPEIITLSKENQSVDLYILNTLKDGDILITQDIGLAAVALKMTKKILNTKGFIYKEENIDQMMFERYLNQLNRKKGISTKHKKRTKEDTKKLIETIKQIIE